MQILYKGRPFILEETKDAFRLTSVEKKNGRYTILEFSKEEEQSNKAVQTFENMLRHYIISNYFQIVS